MQAPPSVPMTTLMFRRLPRKMEVDEFVEQLEEFTSKVEFDFVYVPWHKSGKNNMGYAFVNFTTEGAAARTFGSMSGTVYKNDVRGREVEIIRATIQGLHENVTRYVDTSEGLEDKHCPRVYMNGRPVSIAEAAAACGIFSVAKEVDHGEPMQKVTSVRKASFNSTASTRAPSPRKANGNQEGSRLSSTASTRAPSPMRYLLAMESVEWETENPPQFVHAAEDVASVWEPMRITPSFRFPICREVSNVECAIEQRSLRLLPGLAMAPIAQPVQPMQQGYVVVPPSQPVHPGSHAREEAKTRASNEVTRLLLLMRGTGMFGLD